MRIHPFIVALRSKTRLRPVFEAIAGVGLLVMMGVCRSAPASEPVRVIGSRYFVTAVTNDVELGPAYRGASNPWLNEELADSLGASALAALDRGVLDRVADVGLRLSVVLSITLADRDFTITPGARKKFTTGDMSLIVGASAKLRFEDGREMGPVPFRFAAFRRVPEPAFGEGILLNIGVDEKAHWLSSDESSAAATDVFLRELARSSPDCADFFDQP